MRNDYQDYDALGLAELVRRREVTPAELLETALELAADHPSNAVVAVDPETARAIAQRIPKGPFGGVPFLLKDLYAEAVGLRLTNGSRMWADYIPDHDSVIVERYRAAGLVIFGRTASPELGLTTSTESVLHGQTKNPWNPTRTAGGSSGGAAAAVAAGIVPAAHASDGGGSIRVPASCCGLFGLKPTRARVTMAPDRGEGWSGLSVNHAITRSVRDSAALLDAVAGPAPGDPYFAPPAAGPYLDEVSKNPAPLRIAITTSSFNGAVTDPDCLAAVADAAALCAELGHTVVEARPDIPGDELAGAARVVVSANVRASLEDRAAALGRTLTADDVEPITWSLVQGASGLGIADYPRALSSIHRIGRILESFFLEYDLLLTPTLAAIPPPLGVLSLSASDRDAYLDRLKETIGFTQLMNVAGNPAASLPLHWTADGLPVGVQFAAAAGGEAMLFRLAGQLERARPWFSRRPRWSSAR